MLNSPASGRLWVMRHGKPYLPSNPPRMTREEFNQYLARYDEATVDPHDLSRIAALGRRLPPADVIVASDLPRAAATARALGRDDLLRLDPLFREVPVQVPDGHSLFVRGRWPERVWWHYVRWSWYLGRGPETRQESAARVDAAIAKLLDVYDAPHRRVLLVSHAGFLLILTYRLRKRGLIAGPLFPRIRFGTLTEYRWKVADLLEPDHSRARSSSS